MQNIPQQKQHESYFQEAFWIYQYQDLPHTQEGSNQKKTSEQFQLKNLEAFSTK